MAWDKPDVYYNPEEFGLTPVGEIYFSNVDYEFDFGVVWYHEEQNMFYYAHDSGCSCPSPFENYTSLNHLQGPYTSQEMVRFLRTLKPNDYGDGPTEPIASQVERIVFWVT